MKNFAVLLLSVFTVILIITGESYAQLVTDFKVNTDATTEENRDPQIGTDSAGNFIIIWRDRRTGTTNELYGQRFNYRGAPLGSNFRINSRAPANDANIVVNPDGSFAACWVTNPVVYVQYFNANGDSISAEIPLSNGIDAYSTSIARGINGKYIVCWQNSHSFFGPDNIFMQILDSSGNKIDSVKMINDDTVSADQEFTDITALPDGRFVITWQDNRPIKEKGTWNIFMQMYDADGNKIGSNRLVSENINPEVAQYYPKITSDSLGRFCIGWSEFYPSSEFNGIKIQLYNADGTPKGNNIALPSEGFQYRLNISKRANGDMVVIYGESNTIVAPIYIQRLDSAGGLIGSRSLVSPLFDKQYRETVALFGDRITSVWYDKRSGHGDIYANIRSFTNPDSTVEISQISSTVPLSLKLHQNYPNPFNPSTTIRYEIQKAGNIKLSIYNITGKEVAVIVNQYHTPGIYQAVFSVADMASGIYFYKIDTGTFNEVKRMTLIK